MTLLSTLSMMKSQRTLHSSNQSRADVNFISAPVRGDRDDQQDPEAWGILELTCRHW